MDNLKDPAYPQYIPNGGSGDDYAKGGFTKLELASLMICQGMLAMGPKTLSIEETVKGSVNMAKMVLAEANK